jgi:hypothetical protein
MVSGEVVLGGAGVLGIGADVGPAEHLVARLEPVTVLPTSSTFPARSMPRTGTLGLRSSRVGTTTRIRYGRPVMTWRRLAPSH